MDIALMEEGSCLIKHRYYNGCGNPALTEIPHCWNANICCNDHLHKLAPWIQGIHPFAEYDMHWPLTLYQQKCETAKRNTTHTDYCAHTVTHSSMSGVPFLFLEFVLQPGMLRMQVNCTQIQHPTRLPHPFAVFKHSMVLQERIPWSPFTNIFHVGDVCFCVSALCLCQNLSEDHCASS